METEKISILAEDIKQIVVSTLGEKFEMVRLCKDHHKPVLFKDEKPVLNITQDDFVGIFDMNSNHFYVSPEQVFRLGAYCNIPMQGIVALMLKADWEKYFSQFTRTSADKKSDLDSIFKNKRLIQKYLPVFKPDKGKICNQFTVTPVDQNSNYPTDQIEFIVDDLFEDYKFLSPNNLILSTYSSHEITEKTMLFNASPTQQNNYHRLKDVWKFKSDELTDLLFLFERKKRIAINLENKYFRNFGRLEIKKSRLIGQVEKYQTICSMMTERTDLSYRDLVRMSLDKIKDFAKKNNELRIKFARSNNFYETLFSSDSYPPISEEFKNLYIDTCKKLIKKLYFLLHPDTSNQAVLNKKDKERLNNLWLKLMKSTKNELFNYSPTNLLYHLPDLNILEDIYLRACKILGLTPDKIESGDRLEFMIKKGTPISRIIVFLERDIKNIELHLANCELNRNEYTNEEQAQYYLSALQDLSKHTQELETEIIELNNLVVTFKNRIRKHLNMQYEQQ
jgi:hypothetical protein